MKHLGKKIAAVALGTTVAFAIAGCSGSGCIGANCMGCDANLHLGYIVIEENGHNVLHTVEKWSDDSSSDSVGVRTSCCGNYIWTTANVSNLYEKKPADYAYDMVCPDLHY